MKQNWQWTAVFVTGFRMFLQAILLEREAYNACWLAPAGGFMIALPFVLLLTKQWQKRSAAAIPANPSGRWIRIVAMAYLLTDTAQLVLLYQEGTKFASLSSYPTAVLYLILLLFSFFVIRQPRNGVFGLGSALKFILILSLGALILFRLPDVEIARLSPVFGGGLLPLLRASLSLAGFGFSMLVYLSCAPDFQPRIGAVSGMWATAAAGASVFTALEAAISPVMPGEPAGLYLAVSRLLASGRSQTSLQLVLYLVWFSLMFCTICLNLKCMAILLSDGLRKKENWIIQLTTLLSVTVLANVCEHMMGKDLNVFLDKPGMYRALLLLALLPIGFHCRKQVNP